MYIYMSVSVCVCLTQYDFHEILAYRNKINRNKGRNNGTVKELHVIITNDDGKLIYVKLCNILG